MSEKQREIASKKLREEQRLAGEREDTSERKMANYLVSMKGKEALFEQKKLDEALAPVIKNQAVETVLGEPVDVVETSPAPVPQPAPAKFLKPPKKLKTYHIV